MGYNLDIDAFLFFMRQNEHKEKREPGFSLGVD